MDSFDPRPAKECAQTCADLRSASINLLLEISQRRKAGALLGDVRPATAKTVEGVAVKRVQLSCAA